MASQKRISIGFLFLICLGLSSAHRLLLDSVDDNKPKASPSNLAGGGNGGGVGLTGMEGFGAGFGYGSGHGSGNGGGSGWGVGFGGGKGFGMTPYPGFGQPLYGAEPCPPLECTCPCPCNQGGGWARLNSPSSPAHLEPEITGSMSMPSGWSNMGAHNEPITSNDAKDRHEAHQAPSRYGQFEVAPNNGEATPPDWSAQARGGANTGAHNEPITSNDARDRHEARQAPIRYGPFEVTPNNGEPTPPDWSAQARGGANTGARNEPITSNDAKDRHEAHQAPSSYGPFEVAPNNGEPTPPDRSAQEVPMNDGEPSPPDGSAPETKE